MTQAHETGSIKSDAINLDGKWKALAVISLIQFILLLDATIVNVALPQIKEGLNLTDGSLTWVVTAYAISAGALLLFGGKLGDAYGIHRVFILGTVIFGVFSFVATVAPNAEWLIIGRAGQGIGEALAAATGLAMVSLLFPSGEDRAKAFGIWAALGGIGAIAGVILSGVITETLNWRWIFGINVPLISILVVAAFLTIPVFPTSKKVRLDFGNAMLIAVGVVLMVQGLVGTSIESEHGLRFGLAAVGLIFGALVFYRCRKVEDGIIPARLLKSSPRFTGYVVVIILAATSGALFFLGVLHLQGGLGLSQMMTGLAWLPFCFGFFPGIFLSQFLSQKFSPKTAACTGLIISASGFGLFAWGVTTDSYWLGMLPAMLVTSIGFGCTAPVAQSIATVELSEEDAGAGSGLTSTIQQLSQVFGITVFVALALSIGNGISVGTAGLVFSFSIAMLLMLLGGVVVWRAKGVDLSVSGSS
ncbi:MFS transporter [Rhodobacteraceae bacterium Araon29]